MIGMWHFICMLSPTAAFFTLAIELLSNLRTLLIHYAAMLRIERRNQKLKLHNSTTVFKINNSALAMTSPDVREVNKTTWRCDVTNCCFRSLLYTAQLGPLRMSLQVYRRLSFVAQESTPRQSMELVRFICFYRVEMPFMRIK